MKYLVMAAVLLIVATVPLTAADVGVPPAMAGELESALRSETLWIFDADFEDLLGDNAGWLSVDESETRQRANYWHKDTIRIGAFEHLGDSTWWCGVYNDCWEQPRGYGNDWVCMLERDFPLSEWSEPGDNVRFEWDQRVAMEGDYDYGYVDVSSDGGLSWSNLYLISNRDHWFSGVPREWDDWQTGHEDLDLSSLAGDDARIRFRFESDMVASSQDEPDTQPNHPFRDGAWQLDNIEWVVNGASVWLDDCESPGDNGWEHPDIQASGQTGLTFRRSLEDVVAPARWMMAAYDTVAGSITDGTLARLRSPAIDIDGAPALVAQWSGWVDVPSGSNDRARVRLMLNEAQECLYERERSSWYLWYVEDVGPMFLEETADWSEWTFVPWVSAEFTVENTEPASPPSAHGVGFMLDRFRLGVPLETHVPEEPVCATRLLAPSPNPFNPATTISYSLATAGHVTIRVHDLTSRVVRTLADCAHEAGEYEVLWDGTTDATRRAASGVYFIRMTTAGDGDIGCGDGAHAEPRQQKLVLLK